MMRMMVLAPLLLLVAACGEKEQTVTLKDDKGNEKEITTRSDGETTTVTSGDSKVVIKTGADGADFPAYAPQYPGSSIEGSANFQGTGMHGGTGTMITQTTGDAPDKVMAFYKAKVKEGGKDIRMETNTPEGGILMVGSPTSEDGLMITVSKQGDGKTAIAYMGGRGN